MDDISQRNPRQPAPGIIFEDMGDGTRLILNPDLTVTQEKNGQATTFNPSMAQWEKWQEDAFDAEAEFAPEIRIGEVGRRMAKNYEERLTHWGTRKALLVS